MTKAVLIHGYTLRDLHQMTAAALKADRSLAMDYAERREIAWSAIAEALYAAPHWPKRSTLIQAGWQAIYQAVRDGYRQYGYRDRAWDAGHATAPRFVTFWLDQTKVTPSPETSIVERLALPPILAALTEVQRKVVGAVAAHDGDRELAAAALGIDRRALDHQLLVARRACLALWLEGETPCRTSLRRLDRRVHKGAVGECGTSAGAHRHRSRRETPCELCAPLLRAYDRDRKAGKR